LLAGLSDDDPAGITTYSVLGADHGYQLLWVLVLSTVALVLFHGLAARMGVVTGQGLIGLVRQRYGVRLGGAVLTAFDLTARRTAEHALQEEIARYQDMTTAASDWYFELDQTMTRMRLVPSSDTGLPEPSATIWLT